MLLKIALKLKVQGTLQTENKNFPAFPEEDGVQLKEMPKCHFKCIKTFRVFRGVWPYLLDLITPAKVDLPVTEISLIADPSGG